MSIKEKLELRLSGLSYKNINQDIIDKVLSEVLTGKAKYSNRTLFSIVKGFTYNILKEIGEDGMNVLIVPSHIIEKESGMMNSVGVIRKKSILLSLDHVLELEDGNFEVIDTIFHECRHVYQNKLLRDCVISYDAYRLSIDSVIRDVFSESYYQDNYDNLFLEVDAEIESSIATYKYLKKIVPNLSDRLYEDTKDYVRQCSNDLKVSSRVLSNKTFDYEEIVDEIIEASPEYTDIYPVLSFFYKETGVKVTVGEILARRLEQSDELENRQLLKDLRRLDLQVLKHRSGTRDNLLRDLDSLYNIGFVIDCYKDGDILELRQKLIEHLIMSLLTHKDPYSFDDLIEHVDVMIQELKQYINERSTDIKLAMFVYNEINPLHKIAGEYYKGRKKG